MAPHDLLHITVNRYADETVVALAGDLEIFTAPALARVLDRLTDDDVVIDLRAVAFLDARGLRVILDHDAGARARGRRLTVLRGRPAVHRVFELTGTDRTVRFLEPAVLAA
jgi:anti-anti-sigma factor